MMVRLVSCGVRECRQAGSNRWMRVRQRHHKQEKRGREIVHQNTYTSLLSPAKATEAARRDSKTAAGTAAPAAAPPKVATPNLARSADTNAAAEPAEEAASSVKSRRHAKAKTGRAPSRTEKDEMENSLSPMTSGMSFMMAMMVPNTAKNRVTATLSGYLYI
jgi:hypothetical protein